MRFDQQTAVGSFDFPNKLDFSSTWHRFDWVLFKLQNMLILIPVLFRKGYLFASLHHHYFWQLELQHELQNERSFWMPKIVQQLFGHTRAAYDCIALCLNRYKFNIFAFWFFANVCLDKVWFITIWCVNSRSIERPLVFLFEEGGFEISNQYVVQDFCVNH